MAENPIHVYFHSPCFDGTVSAAIATAYLQKVRGHSEVLLHTVNYDLRGSWLATTLEHPCAVVDFAYHPAADLWADHHSTAFLNDEMRRHYENRRGPNLLYDAKAPSCAVVLWERWGSAISPGRTHFRKLVQWANRIDSARYESAQEAISFEAPAMQITLALAVCRTEAFAYSLVRLLSQHSLSRVAARHDVRAAFEEGLKLHQEGLQRLKEVMYETENGIVRFDVDADNVLVSRYAPFYFYPTARYSAGIVRFGGKAKVTAMRNPWLEFSCAPLGDLCAVLGGGGHHRIGSVLVTDQDPEEVLSRLLEKIDAWDRHASTEAAL